MCAAVPFVFPVSLFSPSHLAARRKRQGAAEEHYRVILCPVVLYVVRGFQ